MVGCDMGANERISLARHLDGWQLGLLAVTIAGLSVWLGLPRPVDPDRIPLPVVDRRVLTRIDRLDLERVARAEREGLVFEVRALGEQVRRYGSASGHHHAGAAAAAREEALRLRRSVERTLGPEPICELRALQTALFLEAVSRYEQRGHADRELEELAGDFVEHARAAGWLDAGRRWTITRSELAVLYRLRWAELTGALESRVLRPALDEFRLYYRVLIEHPEGDSAALRDEKRLSYVGALSRIDDEYPGELARGVVLLRMGRPQAALDAFAAHGATHGDGPWSLRARNYALSALARGGSAE